MIRPEALAADVALALGAGAVRPPRLGAELEWIPVAADTGVPVPIHAAAGGPATLPMLRRLAARNGWRETGTDAVPAFRLPGGGLVAYEPGGQIEYSSPPFAHGSALLRDLLTVHAALQSAADEQGTLLLNVGIDPVTPLERVAQQLHSERYNRMAAYFAGIGPAGARMMRQTASFQVNLDFGPEPALAWRVLNAAAPLVTAIFAHSSRYGGAESGWRSTRARQWRELDPARTGLFSPVSLTGDAAAADYLRFALAAPAMLLPVQGEAPSFGALLEQGRTSPADWAAHLSTLFPEVRPKGYLEVRSIDALPPRWYAAPLVLLAGLVYDPAALRAAADLLGAPDPALLPLAARAGLCDPGIAATARDLVGIALAGAARSTWFDPADLEAAHLFFATYTARGRDLGVG